jgi:ectoine hydroxylase-related dioxygenase (phytanoyl-CoA dioxygenase family)
MCDDESEGARMSKLLSSAAVAQYNRDGFYFPVPVLSAEEAAHFRRRLEQHEAIAGKPLQGNWRHKSHLLFTWADELVHHPKILDAIEDVIGPDILCWTTNFFIKEANNPGFVSWHQDATYWGLDPNDVITAWVALTDVTPENGYMEFLPGSHKTDQLPHVDTFHKDNLLSRGQEIAVEVDKTKTVGIPLRAGEMSLHHIKLVHGSEPNRSNDRRIGLAIRYIPTYVRQTKVRDSAVLVRGTDRFHHFDYEPRPQADLDERALAAHDDAVQRQVKALYQGTSKQEFRA